MIADYYLVRRRVLDIDALYTFGPESKYWYSGGFNPAAMWGFAAGVAPNIPGFLKAAGLIDVCPPILEVVYNYAWFVGFIVGGGLYVFMMREDGKKA